MKLFLSVLVLLITFIPSLAQEEDQFLLKSYQSGSSIMLEHFFYKWAKETPSLSVANVEAMNDTVQNVYALFAQFYDPLKIEKTGGSEWGNDIYKKAKYVLLQDKIVFGLVDTLDRDILLQDQYVQLARQLNISVDSVIRGITDENNMKINFHFEWPAAKTFDTVYHFRPAVNFQTPKTVVLTDRYDRILNVFLGSDHYPFGKGNIMSPAASKGESAKRQAFLENCIKIWYGHWGGYWQLLSYPVVSSIVFDKSFKNALVNYQLIYEGGYAYFKKINGIWTLMEASRTWIE